MARPSENTLLRREPVSAYEQIDERDEVIMIMGADRKQGGMDVFGYEVTCIFAVSSYVMKSAGGTRAMFNLAIVP